MFGGIEAGGTKWICAVADESATIIAEERFPTITPDETIGKAIEFFRRQPGLQSIGVGSFGPIDLNPASPHYGFITTTPKPGWKFTDVVRPLRQAFNIPIGFDTDVNAAALGEFRWGAAQQLDTFIYLTVGTGIGGGAMVNGKLLHGALHPEMGHVLLPLDREREPDGFAGICPFHGHCLEGLACGPAMERRWQTRAETLPHDHPAWSLEAHYLALGLVSFICTLSPQRIILGGGVMQQQHLFPLVRAEVQRLLNNYLQLPQLAEDIDGFIVAPGLGNQAGVKGAIALAQQALKSPR